MPADSPPARYAARVLAASCAVLLLCPANAALARDLDAQDRTQVVADALEESPVYVDPAYESAFPAEDQERVAGAIESSGLDLYVIAVPLTGGDSWGGDPATLVSVVHDRRGGGEGHYLAYDEVSGYHGTDFGPGAQEAAPAHYGALTGSYATDFDGSMLQQADAAVEAALSDDPRAAYEAALQAYEEANPRTTDPEANSDQEAGTGSQPASDTGSGPLVAVGSVVAVLLALVLALLVRNRLTARRGRRRAVSITQHAAFDNADRAQLDSLVEQGERDLIEVGERLSRVDADPGTGTRSGQSLQRALDARSAAAAVHDRMAAEGAALPDAVGVLVLLDIAEDALENAAKGSRSAVRRRHCYANPLHGTNTKVTPWREFGGTRTIRVPLCADCARAVRNRARPVVLPAEHEGAQVPYYEVPAEESVWAATGYGTLTDDLVQRVQRGDHRPRGRTR
ncbi:hypothetical protein [Nocardiopsis sp. HUAS JQ3]|uniref:hypothetical protein n=1 Tax=Nocardiopsis sp. HUAS JQ3 TaxID=3061629 RepID=UPI0023A9892D|nr:hypothetical protein [Nocardiopsis sp. HUAS JQ3]WDZ89039.1 hypothetical protein PV789_19000 [Nocardiopsis sp. HUAS JQ3]